MLNLRLFSFGIVASLALSGCSSVKTEVDKGPTRARSFSFVRPAPRPATIDPSRFAYLHPMVQDGITQSLARRGVTKVASGGDIQVAYLVIAGNNAMTTSLDEYFGYGEEAAALVNKLHKQQTGGGERSYFEEGTIIIDLVDARTQKLLRRTSIQRPVLRNVSPEMRAERLHEAVEEAFQKLGPTL